MLPRMPGFVLLLALASGAAAAPALEICGNCRDDDGDGLVDLADDACCPGARTAAMALEVARIAPGATASGLRLRATLAAAGPLSPRGQQVLLQLGTAPGASFCASLPPSAFRGGPKRLRLARGAAAGSRGLRRMTLRQAADGTIRWRAGGRRVGFTTADRGGALDVLLLLADATDPAAGARCFTARAEFRPGRGGTLVAGP